MNTRQVKSSIHQNADRVEGGVEAAASGLAAGAKKLDELRDALKAKVRGIGQRVADSTAELASQANRQAHIHPLAVFGIAFAAGMVLARAIRR